MQAGPRVASLSPLVSLEQDPLYVGKFWIAAVWCKSHTLYQRLLFRPHILFLAGVIMDGITEEELLDYTEEAVDEDGDAEDRDGAEYDYEATPPRPTVSGKRKSSRDYKPVDVKKVPYGDDADDDEDDANDLDDGEDEYADTDDTDDDDDDEEGDFEIVDEDADGQSDVSSDFDVPDAATHRALDLGAFKLKKQPPKAKVVPKASPRPATTTGQKVKHRPVPPPPREPFSPTEEQSNMSASVEDRAVAKRAAVASGSPKKPVGKQSTKATPGKKRSAAAAEDVLHPDNGASLRDVWLHRYGESLPSTVEVEVLSPGSQVTVNDVDTSGVMPADLAYLALFDTESNQHGATKHVVREVVFAVLVVEATDSRREIYYELSEQQESAVRARAFTAIEAAKPPQFGVLRGMQTRWIKSKGVGSKLTTKYESIFPIHTVKTTGQRWACIISTVVLLIREERSRIQKERKALKDAMSAGNGSAPGGDDDEDDDEDDDDDDDGVVAAAVVKPASVVSSPASSKPKPKSNLMPHKPSPSSSSLSVARSPGKPTGKVVPKPAVKPTIKPVLSTRPTGGAASAAPTGRQAMIATLAKKNVDVRRPLGGGRMPAPVVAPSLGKKRPGVKPLSGGETEKKKARVEVAKPKAKTVAVDPQPDMEVDDADADSGVDSASSSVKWDTMTVKCTYELQGRPDEIRRFNDAMAAAFGGV
jgi:hypothetical protein